MKRVGFIGLGAMGGPMARNLAGAGFELAVFDVDAERTRAAADEYGARAADSAADAATGADALVVMVTNAEQAQEALLGEGGAAAALPEEAAVVVMSTIGPEAVKALAEAGRPLLDAPVSGGVARAETGDLLVMCGGPEELFERLAPVLDAVGATVVHCGERLATGRRSSSSTSCWPASTSPRRPRRSPTRRRSGSTPRRCTTRSATARPPRSCSRTGARAC